MVHWTGSIDFIEVVCNFSPPNTHTHDVYVSEGKKCSIFENLAYFVFL